VLQKAFDLIHETMEYRTDGQLVAIEFCACALVSSNICGAERGYWSRDFVLIGCVGASMLLLVKEHGCYWEV